MNRIITLEQSARVREQKVDDYFSFPDNAPSPIISGIRNIAKYFNCNRSTVAKYYKQGVYGKAMKQLGRLYILNTEKLWL